MPRVVVEERATHLNRVGSRVEVILGNPPVLCGPDG